MSELNKKQKDSMQMNDQHPGKSSVDLFKDDSTPILRKSPAPMVPEAQ